jgi:hypothetical protein
MGHLTNDMTRLRGEVEALRDARSALMNNLRRGARDLTTAVAALRVDFTCTQAARAKQTRGERESFVAAVIDNVNSLLGAFSRDRDDRSRKGRHERRVFLSTMGRQVAGLRQETADDLMGARLAWRGESPGKSRPVPLKKEPVVVKPLSPPVAATMKRAVAKPEPPAVETPKVNTPPSVSASMPFQKRKEKSNWVKARQSNNQGETGAGNNTRISHV